MSRSFYVSYEFWWFVKAVIIMLLSCDVVFLTDFLGVRNMTVGDKLANFNESFKNGYDEKLFDNLWHDEYAGFSNSTGTAVNKAKIKTFMEASKGVVTHSTETLYENNDACIVDPSKAKFSFIDLFAGIGGIIWHKLKDGKIIAHRSGMTKTG